ncbi:MAG TPA: NPCBM/NEW2 domain-containing protein [Pirellulales bacterium]|nr:NPCBM/NEW2 domain-containing protein [Pirellulales bacterium]
MPSATDLKEARREADERIEQDLQAAKTPDQKLNVARKSRRAALNAKPDSAERYALLDQARELAAKAGSSKVAFEAIDELAKWFEIDELDLRLTTLEEAAKAPSTAGKAAKKEQFDSARELIEACVADNRFPEATRAATLAQAAARALRDQDTGLAKQITDDRKELDKLAKQFAAIKDHLARLETDANDPAANLAVGRFYCFGKKDWDRGLPRLAAGGDPALKELARRELAKPNGAEEEKSLGDDWWDMSRKEKGAVKAALASRAGFWYRRAVTVLSGIEKEAVEARLEKIGADGLADKTQFLSELTQTNVVVANNGFAKGKNAATNKPLTFLGKESPHGLFTHPDNNSTASVRYDLEKKARRLALNVAIDDGAVITPRCSLVFQVWGDDKLLWSSVPIIAKGQVAGCEIPLANVKVLELRVMCAGRSNSSAYAVWLEPRVTWKY